MDLAILRQLARFAHALDFCLGRTGSKPYILLPNLRYVGQASAQVEGQHAAPFTGEGCNRCSGAGGKTACIAALAHLP